MPNDLETADAWVFDPTFKHVLLVRHRDHGWVPPGGKAFPGESPRDNAVRELQEETGIAALPVGACIHVQTMPMRDGRTCVTRCFPFVVPIDVAVTGEAGQPARWFRLDDNWDSIFPDDHRLLADAALSLRKTE